MADHKMSSEFLRLNREVSEAEQGKMINAHVERTRAQTVNLDSSEGFGKFGRQALVLYGKDVVTSQDRLVVVAPQVSTDDPRQLDIARNYLRSLSLRALHNLVLQNQIGPREADRIRNGIVLRGEGIEFRAQNADKVDRKAIPNLDRVEASGKKIALSFPKRETTMVHAQPVRAEKLSKKSKLRRAGIVIAAGFALAGCSVASTAGPTEISASPTVVTSATQVEVATATATSVPTETAIPIPEVGPISEADISSLKAAYPESFGGRRVFGWNLNGDKYAFSKDEATGEGYLFMHDAVQGMWIPLVGHYDESSGEVNWVAILSSGATPVPPSEEWNTAPSELVFRYNVKDVAAGGQINIDYKVPQNSGMIGQTGPDGKPIKAGDVIPFRLSSNTDQRLLELKPVTYIERSAEASPEEIQELADMLGPCDSRGCIYPSQSPEGWNATGMTTGYFREVQIQREDGVVLNVLLTEFVVRTNDKINDKQKGVAFWAPVQAVRSDDPLRNADDHFTAWIVMYDFPPPVDFTNPVIQEVHDQAFYEKYLYKGRQVNLTFGLNGKPFYPKEYKGTELMDPEYMKAINDFLSSGGVKYNWEEPPIIEVS
jgi:hypothetical protein